MVAEEAGSVQAEEGEVVTRADLAIKVEPRAAAMVAMELALAMVLNLAALRRHSDIRHMVEVQAVVVGRHRFGAGNNPLAMGLGVANRNLLAMALGADRRRRAPCTAVVLRSPSNNKHLVTLLLMDHMAAMRAPRSSNISRIKRPYTRLMVLPLRHLSRARLRLRCSKHRHRALVEVVMAKCRHSSHSHACNNLAHHSPNSICLDSRSRASSMASARSSRRQWPLLHR